MHGRSRWRWVSVAVLANMAMAETALATPSLLERSPFIPTGFSPRQASAQQEGKVSTGGYELRGIYQMGDKYWFLIGEARSAHGKWIELGKSYDDYEVRHFDPSSRTVTLYANNREESLQLAELEANPTPIPIAGDSGTGRKAAVRRQVRPPQREAGPDATGKKPPEWLERLRQEAAERRAQANMPGVRMPDAIPETATVDPLDGSTSPGPDGAGTPAEELVPTPQEP